VRRTRKPRLSLVTVGVISLIAAVVITYFGFTKALPFRDHFEVRAVFASANNIKPNSAVRIAGVNVGKVVKVEHGAKGRNDAVVTMRMERKGLALHDDATFKIRPRIFLEGNFFVDVNPGSPSAPLTGDGDVFPVNQTATPVQLDQVLTTLQRDTREDLQSLLQEYGTALDKGGAEGFNRSIPYWERAYRDTALVNQATLGTLEHDLSNYIDNAGEVAEALDRDPEALKALITDFNTTAKAFAREGGNLRRAIAELPRTLRAAQPALGALNASFPALRGLARDLTPGVRSSGPALDASIPFVRQLRGLVSQPELRGLVSDLRPAVPELNQLTDKSVPLYKEVRRAASCQGGILVPWGNDTVGDEVFKPNGPVYQEAPKPFVGLAGESRSSDANGQWISILLTGGTNVIQQAPGVFSSSTSPVLGVQPPMPRQDIEERYDQPCENQERPDLRSTPGAPPPQKKVDTSSPAYQARYAKARAAAIEWLKDDLKRRGLAGKLKVADVDATPQLLEKVEQVKQQVHQQTVARARAVTRR
jgi:virulence factor Mce-like protein